MTLNYATGMALCCMAWIVNIAGYSDISLFAMFLSGMDIGIKLTKGDTDNIPDDD